ncbi:type II toxin-antitoxin system RelE/ParE family toxin [Longimicrobium sp.]|uniref:type II toxin-antitoxin system RelE/ParE family toxin n=1 Tax=Longimicrobium sp. TaxID=2029185 RepID=UPI002BC265F0|nr:type II toxin-antitoxin system RelE/ParE family toxin [Longimicrobium sp.]HSU16564.1 type II toxin-antitoxin system RelE/ParE family toxin [Longimicrobium sp.]
MIISFRNRGTEDIFRQVDSQQARNLCPPDMWPVARRKLAAVDAAESLAKLKTPLGNRLHPLRRERVGQHAIRINDQYRVCFRWTESGAEDVEITDYH